MTHDQARFVYYVSASSIHIAFFSKGGQGVISLTSWMLIAFKGLFGWHLQGNFLVYFSLLF